MQSNVTTNLLFFKCEDEYKKLNSAEDATGKVMKIYQVWLKWTDWHATCVSLIVT